MDFFQRCLGGLSGVNFILTIDMFGWKLLWMIETLYEGW
jgi:hypothetical protein